MQICTLCLTDMLLLAALASLLAAKARSRGTTGEADQCRTVTTTEGLEAVLRREFRNLLEENPCLHPTITRRIDDTGAISIGLSFGKSESIDVTTSTNGINKPKTETTELTSEVVTTPSTSKTATTETSQPSASNTASTSETSWINPTITDMISSSSKLPILSTDATSSQPGPDRGCVIEYNSSCFWTFVEDNDYTYNEAENICRKQNSTVAKIPNENVYQSVVDDIRNRTSNHVNLWIDLQINPSNPETQTATGIFTKWNDGYPTNNTDSPRVSMRIHQDGTGGMENVPRDWNRHGVVCEMEL